MAAGEMDRALADYSAAAAMFPDNDEFIFWHAPQADLADSAQD